MWWSIRRLIGTLEPSLLITSTRMSVMWPSTIGFGGLNSSSRVSTWYGATTTGPSWQVKVCFVPDVGAGGAAAGRLLGRRRVRRRRA